VIYMQAYQESDMKQPPLRHLLRDPLAAILTASHCGLDDRGAVALAAVVPHLIYLRRILLSDNRLGDEGCSILCQAIARMSGGALEEIDLDNNRIRRAGAQDLALILRNGKVASLSISANRMGDEAVARLGEGLVSQSCRVEYLDISANEAGELTCKALAAALAAHDTKLKSLDISWNSLRGHAGAKLTEALLHNTCLTSLNAAWNGFGGMESVEGDSGQAGWSDELAKFVDSWTVTVFQNPSRGASVSMQNISLWLAHTKSLRFLDLSHNRISAEGRCVCVCVRVYLFRG
jgi:Ran GTPase-activating protein (RanGAP) involved in mRNA processing and transport